MISLNNTFFDTELSRSKIEAFFEGYQPHFLDVLNDEQQIKDVEKFVETHLSKAKHLSVIGFGGSSLGLKAIVEALDLENQVSFFDNVDAHNVQKKIKQINLENNHWLFISKSGKTIEVIALIDIILQKDSKALQRMSVITTDNSNPLQVWAHEKNVPTFYVPENIGGRFSIFTGVGLVPLMYLKQDISEIKRGVNSVLNDKTKWIALTQQLYSSIKMKQWLHLYWFYSDSLSSLGTWLQQLWMESLGKKSKIDGTKAEPMSSLFMARGVSDQHSILQDIVENDQKKLIVFIGDERSCTAGDKIKSSQNIVKHNLSGFGLGKLLEIEREATQQAVNKLGISNLGLHFDELNLASLSTFMTAYMMSVVAIADMVGVDPFNQPGVESSKAEARQLLSRLRL